MLEPLIEWVKQYETRTDEYGLNCHRQIFAAFPGNKRELTTPDAYSNAAENWQA